MTVQVHLNVIPPPEEVDRIEKVLANQVRADTDPFVPFLSGNLAQSAEIGDNEGKTAVIYPIKYAGRQFDGGIKVGKPFNYTKTFHPLATSYWIDNSKEANMPRWENLVKEELLK